MAKRKKLTEEESKEEWLQNSLRHVLFGIENIPEPSYVFKVGANVSVGNLNDCFVEEVLLDGKVYLINYTRVDNNYGKPLIYPNSRLYFDWLSVRPPYNHDNHHIIENEDLELYYSQRTIDGVLGIIYGSAGVDMNPEYQRDYVWGMNDKRSLIRSVFTGIDIGKFVFVRLEHEDGKPLYEILDGKQRLNALCEFFENRFDYNGYFFNELSKREMYHFNNYPISYSEIRTSTREQKLRYFLKLNTSGKYMSKEHLKKVERMLKG